VADSLVALRDRREQVIVRISECFASDVLEVDELERRLDLAHRATTLAELEALVADLAPAPSAASTALAVAPSVAPPVAYSAIDDPSRADRKQLRVVMGTVARRGAWTVPRRLDARVFWGNLELDFRDASFGAGVTVVDVSVTMANLEVILPPGLAVDVDVSSFMGNVDARHRVPPTPDPTRPVLRFEGTVRLGNLEVVTRLPGESAGDARRRERAERRARRKQRKKQRKALRAGGEM
jgi:hypothetical protein